MNYKYFSRIIIIFILFKNFILEKQFITAAEVLASDHPFVKTRSLKEATPLSRSKAQKSSEFLQPYRARPKTCAALARRLVTKSLGVKLATAREEREQEKIVLREAKGKFIYWSTI